MLGHEYRAEMIEWERTVTTGNLRFVQHQHENQLQLMKIEGDENKKCPSWLTHCLQNKNSDKPNLGYVSQMDLRLEKI